MPTEHGMAEVAAFLNSVIRVSRKVYAEVRKWGEHSYLSQKIHTLYFNTRIYRSSARRDLHHNFKMQGFSFPTFKYDEREEKKLQNQQKGTSTNLNYT